MSTPAERCTKATAGLENRSEAPMKGRTPGP